MSVRSDRMNGRPAHVSQSPPQPSGILLSKLLCFSVPGSLCVTSTAQTRGVFMGGIYKAFTCTGSQQVSPRTSICCPTKVLELQNAVFLGNIAAPWFALLYLFSNGLSETLQEPNFHLEWHPGVSATVRAHRSSCSLLVMPRHNIFSFISCWALSGCLCQWFVRCRGMERLVGKDHWGGSPFQLLTLNGTISKQRVSLQGLRCFHPLELSPSAAPASWWRRFSSCPNWSSQSVAVASLFLPSATTGCRSLASPLKVLFNYLQAQ